MQVIAADGTVLLQYTGGLVHWPVDCDTSNYYGTQCYIDDTMVTWAYKGMEFKGCNDACTADITMGPYYNGETYVLDGSYEFSNEWLSLAFYRVAIIPSVCIDSLCGPKNVCK